MTKKNTKKPAKRKSSQTKAGKSERHNTAENKKASTDSIRKTAPARQYDSQINTFTLMEEMMTNTFNYEKFSKETLASFQEGSEAVAKAGSLALKGMEDYLKGVSEISRKTAETNAGAVKEIMGCNTLNELAEAQQKVMQATFDDALENASKLSELSVRTVTQALEPVNTHFTKTYKKVGYTFAA